jgi:hypothetical protein
MIMKDEYYKWSCLFQDSVSKLAGEENQGKKISQYIWPVG